MSENHFAKALHNFTMDAAAGDAIRHLTDKGYTLMQIKDKLTFPAPSEYIAQVMWERMVSKRTVLFEKPGEGTASAEEPGPIVESFDRYGRKSFLRVNKKSSEEVIFSPEDYVQYENLWVLKHAQEQVSSLSDHIPRKVRSTGSHRDK